MAEPSAHSLRILIVGAGGHGQVVADLLLAASESGGPVTPIGYVDDDAALAGQTRLELPVLGSVAAVDDIEHDAVIVAIGDNATRHALYARLHARLAARGERGVSAVHPAAILARDVTLGAGTVVCARAVVNACARVGVNAILNTGCVVEHHCRIGDHAHIAPGACLGGEATVGRGALIGIGAVVLPGVTVGEWCVVGAGAVVTRNLPDRAVAVGVPARVIGQL